LKFLKRTAAILLLAILLFNWVGYRLFVSYVENQNDSRLEAQLDKDEYNESELISLKVPATYLSYYNNSKSFERVDGQIEINGISYKYVKRRLYNDSVELLCIPNIASMRLQNAKDNFFKITNDLQNAAQNKKASSHSVQKNFSVSFCPIQNISLKSELFFSSLKRINTDNFHFPSPFISQPDQPPKIS
jgi:hypothetical protein